jgi:hypothetical protein
MTGHRRYSAAGVTGRSLAIDEDPKLLALKGVRRDNIKLTGGNK